MTILAQWPTLDAKLATRGSRIDLYKADRPVASLLSFRSIQSSVAVCEFHTTGEERCERGHLCEPLMPNVMRPKRSGPTFEFTAQEFNMVGGYTENLEKPHNCQNLGVSTCVVMDTYPGQRGKFACI